ncbi:hypothetical protein ACEPAI_2206 [Sanghuangporus weigelae]
MWAKVTSAFRRGDGDASSVQPQQDEPGLPRPSHDESTSDSAGEQVPSSPTKNVKRTGLLRRGSRLLDKENGASLSLAKRVKSSLHINSNLNESNMSLTSTATKTEFGGDQPVIGSVRSIFGKSRRPSAMQMQAALNKSDDALNRNSEEMHRPSSPSPTSQEAQPPLTPLDARQYGSVRSILRDRNTPGSGQNVRFFSRDAYRVISPNTTATTSTDNTGNSANRTDNPFMQRIQEMSPDRDAGVTSQDTTRYLSANSSPGNIFSPASVYASPNSAGFENYPTATSTPYVMPDGSQAQSQGNMPPPPPQLAGVFELSAAQEHGVHSIRANGEGALREDAVEIDEYGRPVLRSMNPTTVGARSAGTMTAQTENRVSSHSTASSMSIATPSSIVNGSEASVNHLSDADDTKFYSLGAASEEGGEKHEISGRAGLAKVFKRESGTPADARNPKLDFPGSGGNNASSRVRALSERVFFRPAVDGPKDIKVDADNFTPQADKEPDPFSADANNYYNPAAGFPKTPPRIGHVRSDSVVSGVSVNSGRSVSAVSHHSGSGSRSSHGSAREYGLSAEDIKIINALRTKLAFHEELATQYEADIRARDAHAALMSQKLQAHEAEAERRAKAMRGMRKRVAELERAAAALEEQAEKNALESFERSVLDGASGDALKSLKMQMVEMEREKIELERREREAREESERLLEELRRKQEALMEMKRQLETGTAPSQVGDQSLGNLQFELTRIQQESAKVAARYQEIEVSRAEDQERLVGEMESLQKELKAKTSELNMLKAEVEAQWANTEKLNEKVEKAEKERDDIEREREHLKNEISALEARMADMEMDWTESENRKAQLESELAAVLNEKEEIKRERDQLRRELERKHSQGDSDDDYETEQLRTELASLRREHARMQTDHARSLSEAEVRASDAIELRNETARRHHAAEVEARELREKLAKIQEENEKLRKNVNALKQESAGQDVKILQLEKMHEQDTEDKVGLNIALDSKQQELELIKRQLGVRGTAGATPAVTTRTGIRRNSGAFKTPVPLRPGSSLSDGAAVATTRRTAVSLSDTERSGKMAGAVGGKPTLGKSVRPNVGSMPSLPSIRKAKTSRLSDASLSAPPGGPSGRARSGTAGSDTPKPSTRSGASVPAARRAISPNSTAATVTPGPGRRASIAISGIGSIHMSDTGESSALSQSDKENETPRPNRPVGTAVRRKSMQPLAVPA